MDGLNDIINARVKSVGVDASQFKQATDLAQDVWKATSENVYFIGHSAGGALAVAAAYATGGDAITFNSQGYSPPAGQVAGNITNYYIPGDILTTSQHFFPIPMAQGTQIALPPNSF